MEAQILLVSISMESFVIVERDAETDVDDSSRSTAAARVVEREQAPSLFSLSIEFMADLGLLRSKPFKSDYRWISSESFQFTDDKSGRLMSIHLKVQESKTINPGHIGIFLHHDEDEESDDATPLVTDDDAPTLSLSEWELGVVLPCGEKIVRAMKESNLGAHGMGWPSFVEPNQIPNGASSLVVTCSITNYHRVALKTREL